MTLNPWATSSVLDRQREPGDTRPAAHDGDTCAAPGCTDLLHAGETVHHVLGIDEHTYPSYVHDRHTRP